MLLSTLANQFVYNLPIDITNEAMEANYVLMRDNYHFPFPTCYDYLCSTIKTITFPSMTFETVQQTMKRGKKTQWKTVQNIHDTNNKQVDITFNSVDGNLNYILLREGLIKEQLRTDKAYSSNMSVIGIDYNRRPLYHIIYRSVLFTSISEFDFDYSLITADDKTFTVTFTYNYLDVEFLPGMVNLVTQDEISGMPDSKTLN